MTTTKANWQWVDAIQLTGLMWMPVISCTQLHKTKGRSPKKKYPCYPRYWWFASMENKRWLTDGQNGLLNHTSHMHAWSKNIRSCIEKNGGGRPANISSCEWCFEGEGPVYFIMWMTSVSTYLGRQTGGGVPHRKNELKASLRPYRAISASSSGVSNIREP